MTQRQKALLSCAVAAALLLSGCRKGSSDSGSMSSSNAMSGSSGSASTTQTGGWKTGLGILTEASDEARTGTIHTIAAAVLLDGDGKLADVMLDELEVEVTADGKGVVTMPTDYRTKRQKGDDYPLAAASSLKKGWAEQADDFADYLTGMTPEQAGAFVAHTAMRKGCKPIRTIGLQYKFFHVLSRILPCRLLNWLVGLLYAK